MSTQPAPIETDELRWTMTRVLRDDEDEREERFDFDLSALRPGYAVPLLLAIKAALLKRRNQVSLSTIRTESEHLKSVLLSVQESRHLIRLVDQIDLPFLTALETIKKTVSRTGLACLKRFFILARSNNYIFSTELRPEDFPLPDSPLGGEGEAIKRILSQALSRSALSQALTTIENAYEEGELDIGQYSFAMLAFQVYFRPASYRSLRLMDLHHDKDEATGLITWFVDMLPVKTRTENPNRLAIRLTADVGEIVKLQQADVVKKYGHLVTRAELGKLALFPARQLASDGTWKSNYANIHYGMFASSQGLTNSYLKPIKQLLRRHISFNALRHTVGTQLALAGLSASSIAAVLRHATDETCQVYVDLFFQGALDRISDSMQPSFDEHFPAYKAVAERAISKHDPIPKEKAIVSEDMVTGRREVTAECGRQSLCGYAPLACYDCNKFRPCWDADHTINLDVVNREIADFQGQGLAMQHETQKYKHLRNAIRVVISLCQLRAGPTATGTVP